MRICITGLSGFVGSHIAEHFVNNLPEHEVHGLVRWRSSLDNIKAFQSKLRLWHADLTDLSSLIKVLGLMQPDLIYHLAAQSFVPASFVTPTLTLETNGIGTINLFEAVRFAKLDPIIVMASSSEVYGQVREQDIPITEDCPLRPVSPYGVSKVAEDMAGFMYYQAYGLRIIRIRMFSHEGPRRPPGFACSAFAYQIAKIEKGLQPPVVKVGNLDSIRTYCDVRDAVKAYELAAMCPLGEVYNIGGRETMTVGEVLNALIGMSSREDIQIEREPHLFRPKDVTLQIPDSSKFHKETGWQPIIPFSRTLSDLLSFWRSRV